MTGICCLIKYITEKATYPEVNRITIIKWFFMKHDLSLSPHYKEKKLNTIPMNEKASTQLKKKFNNCKQGEQIC